MPEAPRTSLAAALLAALLGSGCATVGNFQTADVLAPGKFQFAIEPSYYQRSANLGDEIHIPSDSDNRVQEVVISGENLDTSLGLNRGSPALSGAARVGVVPRLDLGLRWGANGLDLLGKVQLTPLKRKDLVVSLAPSIGGLVWPTGDTTSKVLSAQCAALVGMRMGTKGMQLVWGPKVSDWRAWGAVQKIALSAHYLSVGGSVGLAIPLGHSVRLVPEVALGFPLSLQLAADDGTDTYAYTMDEDLQPRVTQIGIAVLLGE